MDAIRRYGLFVTGALVILASVVWFIVGLLGVITRSDDGLVARIVAPATQLVHLEGGKTYTVFLEHRSVVDGKVYNSRPRVPLHMTVTENASGIEIKLQPPRVRSTYSMGGRQGFSLVQFDVERTGRYTVEVGNQRKEPFVVVVGDNFVTGTIGAIFGVILRLFGGFLAGGLIIVVALLRRRGSGTPPSPPPVPYAPYPTPPPR